MPAKGMSNQSAGDVSFGMLVRVYVVKATWASHVRRHLQHHSASLRKTLSSTVGMRLNRMPDQRSGGQMGPRWETGQHPHLDPPHCSAFSSLKRALCAAAGA